LITDQSERPAGGRAAIGCIATSKLLKAIGEFLPHSYFVEADVKFLECFDHFDRLANHLGIVCKQVPPTVEKTDFLTANSFYNYEAVAPALGEP